MIITIQVTNAMFFVIDPTTPFIKIYLDHVPFVMHKNELISLLKELQ